VPFISRLILKRNVWNVFYMYIVRSAHFFIYIYIYIYNILFITFSKKITYVYPIIQKFWSYICKATCYAITLYKELHYKQISFYITVQLCVIENTAYGTNTTKSRLHLHHGITWYQLCLLCASPTRSSESNTWLAGNVYGRSMHFSLRTAIKRISTELLKAFVTITAIERNILN